MASAITLDELRRYAVARSLFSPTSLARDRKDHGPANLAVLRRRVRDVAARDTAKGSLAIKLKRAGWNEAYMIELLHHMR